VERPPQFRSRPPVSIAQNARRAGRATRRMINVWRRVVSYRIVRVRQN
jgi:hypothetical protein